MVCKRPSPPHRICCYPHAQSPAAQQASALPGVGGPVRGAAGMTAASGDGAGTAPVGVGVVVVGARAEAGPGAGAAGEGAASGLGGGACGVAKPMVVKPGCCSRRRPPLAEPSAAAAAAAPAGSIQGKDRLSISHGVVLGRSPASGGRSTGLHALQETGPRCGPLASHLPRSARSVVRS